MQNESTAINTYTFYAIGYVSDSFQKNVGKYKKMMILLEVLKNGGIMKSVFKMD